MKQSLVDYLRWFFLASLLLATQLHAAEYERPAGAYTPTTFTTNSTKYQDDSGAVPRRAISSAKVDGDLNKAFDGLNELHERLSDIEDSGGVTDGNKGVITVSGSTWTINPFTVPSISVTTGLSATRLDVSGTGLVLNAQGATQVASISTVNASRISVTSLHVGEITGVRLGFQNMQVFAASGAFQPPASITRVFVEVCGAGGGGGGVSAAAYVGAGGGGGGKSSGFLDVTPLVSSTVTVGTGGGGGSTSGGNGGNGGDSSFAGSSVTLTGAGGAGGAGATAFNINYPGGGGGSASGTGAFNVSGQAGGYSLQNNSVGSAGGGYGGNSACGGGGGQTPGWAFTAAANGSAGVAPGGGGSGAKGISGNAANGGAGGDGRVIVYY